MQFEREIFCIFQHFYMAKLLINCTTFSSRIQTSSLFGLFTHFDNDLFMIFYPCINLKRRQVALLLTDFNERKLSENENSFLSLFTFPLFSPISRMKSEWKCSLIPFSLEISSSYFFRLNICIDMGFFPFRNLISMSIFISRASTLETAFNVSLDGFPFVT